jgi:HAD superfamily hydrolase (TIGR01509 family)
MIRGVVFDMDGVLIDSHPVHKRAWRRFLGSVGRRTTERELDFILDGRKREEILRYFFADIGPEQIEEYGSRKDEMLREIGDEMQPVPGVVRFLEELSEAGIRMALATSARRRRVEGTLMELGLANYFSLIVTGDDVDAGKPDPAIYRLAAERLQELPKHLLAVEDAVAGIKSALAAGIRCIGVASQRRADALRSAGADPVVPDFMALSLAELEISFDDARD